MEGLDEEESLHGGISLEALQSETSCSELMVREEEVAVSQQSGKGEVQGLEG